jgi:hypothetical protein
MQTLNKVILTSCVILTTLTASEIKSIYNSDDVSLNSSATSYYVDPHNTPVSDHEIELYMVFDATQYEEFLEKVFDPTEYNAFEWNSDTESSCSDPPLDYIQELDDDDVLLIPIQ